MKRQKAGKSGSVAPIEEPEFIRHCLRTLRTEGIEFPLKVDGASTLPYTSQVADLEWETGHFILRLLRPLPHELASGASFSMVFTAGEQRYEGLANFVERDGYLQYRFKIPKQIFHLDRRRPARMAFRPREAAYVVAQSSSLTGVGVAGPLINISIGGLALRLDRLLRLEDRMRLPIHAGSLDVGLVFERIRLQDLPKLPFLEVRGRVAHLTPKGEELIVGIEFGELSEEEALALQGSLSFREKLARGPSVRQMSPASPAKPHPSDNGSNDKTLEPETAAEAEGDEGEDSQGDSPLRILQRRTIRLGLIMADSEVSETILGLLKKYGYHRIERVRDHRQAGLVWTPASHRPHLVISDLDSEPETFRKLREKLGSIPGILLSASADPSRMMDVDSRARILPLKCLEGDEEEQWIHTVDGLAEIED